MKTWLILIYGFLIKLQKKAATGGSRLWDKFTDQETDRNIFGKNGFRIFVWTIGMGIVASISIAFIMSKGRVERGGLIDQKKEWDARGAIRARKIDNKGPFGVDAMAGLMTSGASSYTGSTGLSTSPSTPYASGPSTTECYALIDRMKKGEELSTEELAKTRTCAERDIVKLDAETKASIMAATDPLTTPEERAKIVGALNGKETEEIRALKNARAREADIVGALAKKGVEVSGDAVKKLGSSLAESSGALASAINKAAKGSDLSEKDKKAIIEALKSQGESLQSDPTKSDNKTAAMRELAEQMRRDRQELEDLQDKLAQAQSSKEARDAAENIKSGKSMNEEQQAAMDQIVALTKRANEIKKRMAETSAAFRDIKDQVKSELDDVSNMVVEDVYSYVGEKELSDGDAATPKRKKSIARKTPKKKIVLREKPMVNLAMNDDLYGESFMDKRADLNFKENEKEDIGKSFTQMEKSGKAFNLTPDMKIPAKLITKIDVRSGGSQQFRIQISADVYDPLTKQLVIPKGALAVGPTGSFDEETAIMDLVTSKIVAGGKVIDIPLRVGSADGSMGLKGYVKSGRTGKIWGAAVAAFTSGVLSGFSQAFIADYQSSKQFSDMLTGAALSGGKEAADKAANVLVNDLQNAPDKFMCPANIDLILYPD